MIIKKDFRKKKEYYIPIYFKEYCKETVVFIVVMLED